ncbi:glutathione S-transferase U18-like [Typha angustifolia]|uniref:glutathione S-transferase U18-like n=1 Tax=Typha angustifolia TaxID=59011 RepID=UPI003C2CC261
MEGEDVKLLGLWASPFVMRVRIALNLKGVKYTYSEENLKAKSELLLKFNPVYKKVPVLIHEGKPLCESLVIMQYIDEVWAASGPAILPTNPYDRAIHRFWAVYLDDKWLSAAREIITLQAKTEEATAAAIVRMQTGLELLEEVFDKCSKGKSFFGGDSIEYLDIALGSSLSWIKVMELLTGAKIMDENKTPLLVRWGEKFCAHDAVKGVMTDVEKLLEYANGLQAFYRNALPAQ